MSSSAIQCPKCHTDLADMRPAGTIKLRPGVFVIRITPSGGEARCPTCGRVTTLVPRDAEQKAA